MNRSLHDAERLIAWMEGAPQFVVAFSGGVDSSVVAAAAQASGVGAIAVTADSPAVARWQIEVAQTVAAEIGIRHELVRTEEGSRPDYRRNDTMRCYHCKETLYDALNGIADRYPDATILSGTNADDLGDYRPGIRAGQAAGVATPLADLGIGKEGVRELARYFRLSNHDLPASPCLASRIAYGTEVTPERLRIVEQAESWLAARGFSPLRVRLHEGELARIEVSRGQLTKLIELDESGELSRALKGIGFRYVTVDLAGFESGSMNLDVVPLGAASISSVPRRAQR